MGAPGKGRTNVTAYTTTERRDYVKSRADRLGWSVSQFMGDTVLEFWIKQGCPAVAETDKLMPRLPFTESPAPAR